MEIIELMRKNLAYRLQAYLSEHHLTVEQMAAIAQVPTCAVEKALKCGDSSLGDIDNLSVPLQIADVWDFFKAPDDKYFTWLLEQLTEETRQIDQSNQWNGTEIEKISDGA